MLKTKILFSSFIAFVTLTSCARGTNLLAEMSDRRTDAAIYYRANKALETGRWTSAINAVAELSDSYRARREVQVLLASAYAGRCGLDVLALAQSLSNPTAGSNFFQTIFTALNGATTTEVADCVLAETTLKTIWGTANPSSSNPVKENLLMAFVGLAKIGAIINAYGDTTPADNTLDWSRTGSNYPCENTGAGNTALPVAQVTELVTGFALTIQGFAAAGSSGSTALSDLVSECTNNAALAATGICTATSAASVNATHRQGFRALLEETTDGIGLKIFNGDLATTVLSCLNAD